MADDAIVAQLTRIADALERAHGPAPDPGPTYLCNDCVDPAVWRAAERDLRALANVHPQRHMVSVRELRAIIARHWGEP